MKRLFLVAALTSLYAAPVFAEDEEANDSGEVDEESGRKVMYKSKTEIDFEGLDVSGEMQKPQGTYLMDRKKASFNPLIKLREDFNPEMEQSVDEVK